MEIQLRLWGQHQHRQHRTNHQAAKGDIIQVEVDGLVKRDDGRIAWQNAKAIKLQPKLNDLASKILKMAKKEKK